LTRKKYQLTIQYDGSGFHGWQVQAEGRTIQGDIETALSIIYPKEKITLFGSGRTDAGVHALSQVAHVELPSRLSAPELCQALNGNLEREIRIDSVEEADNDFHARFSAKAREYEYHLVKKYSPITRNHAAELKWDINIDLLNECAETLKGEHDFTFFCKSTAEVENKTCHVHEAKWENKERKHVFTIRANRFLQHMVRYIVGTTLEVARGRYEVMDFKNILNGNQTKAKVVRAPAKGLFLKKVYYD